MPDEQVIHVQGRGEVEARPDIVLINLGVASRETEARMAMQAASEAMQAIIAAVRDQGVPDYGIQTGGLNIHFDQQASVYVVNQQVSIRTEEVAKAGAILDAAVEAGANASSGIRFALADPAEPEDRALELAIADVRRKAETVARAMGITIDQVVQVTAAGQGVTHGEYVSVRAARAAPSQHTPIETGQLRIIAGVNVTYSFH